MLIAQVFDASEWLRRAGVPVPAIRRVREGADPPGPAGEIPGPPWVLKADVALGGKGLLGLVSVVRDPAGLAAAAQRLRDRLAGLGHRGDLVVQEYTPGRELYLSWSLDGDTGAAVLRVGAHGGSGFDAAATPARAFGVTRQPPDHAVRAHLDQAVPGLGGRTLTTLTRIAGTLWRLWYAAEATLVEINPLTVAESGAPVCVGHNLEFDPRGSAAALGFRPPLHPVGAAGSDADQTLAAEIAAAGGVGDAKFVRLDGDVAMLVGGGGAGLMCLDRLTALGLRPACAIDTSPGMSDAARELIYRAGLTLPGIRGALVGAVVVSVVDSRVFARALIRAIKSLPAPPAYPIVARIAGPYEAEAAELIRESGVPVEVHGRTTTLEDACDRLAAALGVAA